MSNTFVVKLFNPEDHSKSHALNWTIRDFFDVWYLPSVQNDPKRRPQSESTVLRRRAAVDWWSRLMGSKAKPDGPCLAAITVDDLATFRDRLKKATFQRGKKGERRPLSEWSQFRTFNEIQQLLLSAGPSTVRARRAEVLEVVPGIYDETPPAWPKETWDIEEAKKLAQFVGNMDATKVDLTKRRYQLLAQTTLAFWYYTGHRATTYENLTFADLIDVRDGACLQIRKSVKTGKADRLRVHPQLHEFLMRIKQTFGAGKLVPWPVAYRCVSDYHDEWQEGAGLAEKRRFRPQAWRRLHASQIAAVGYETARSFAATSLGHSCASITETHYTAVRDIAISNLPKLF